MNARQGAAIMRHKAYMAMLSRSILEPSSHRTMQERLWHREQRFVPGLVWSPVWTEAAQRAYYGLPARSI